MYNPKGGGVSAPFFFNLTPCRLTDIITIRSHTQVCLKKQGEKMKVRYKNLCARKYVDLAEIDSDIVYIKTLIASLAKKFKSDLKIARKARKEFKKENNL